jgi:hypothetical protein
VIGELKCVLDWCCDAHGAQNSNNNNKMASFSFFFHTSHSLLVTRSGAQIENDPFAWDTLRDHGYQINMHINLSSFIIFLR